MNNLKKWQDFWAKCDEAEFAEFVAQNKGLLTQLQENWLQFVHIKNENNVSENMPNSHKNANATTVFRQPESEISGENENIIVCSENHVPTQHENEATDNTVHVPELPESATKNMTPNNTVIEPNHLPTPSHQNTTVNETNLATVNIDNMVLNNTTFIPSSLIQNENEVANTAIASQLSANESVAPTAPETLVAAKEKPLTTEISSQPEPQKTNSNPMPPTKHSTPLPNARKGETYFAQLPPNAKKLHFQPECGLVWEEDTQCITGIPNYSGDIQITYYLDNGNLDPIHHSLYINPNPKDLWANIPTDRNIPFYKEDNYHEEPTITPHGMLLAARVRGRSHAHTGKPCDDDFAIRYHSATGLHFIAVSDGAGSAEYSRLGSQVAVDNAADAVWQKLGMGDPNFSLNHNQDIKQRKEVLVNLVNHAAYQAMVALYQTAKDNGIELKKLSCTLLFILSLPIEDGTWINAIYSVGDGALAIWLPENQTLVFVAESDSGSYSGETRFLTADETTLAALQKRTRCGTCASPPVLFAMTDGVSDPKFETDAQLKNPQKWQDLWAELQDVLQDKHPEQALERWLNFWSAGNHDDRTLAMFVPKGFLRLPETPSQPTENPESTS